MTQPAADRIDRHDPPDATLGGKLCALLLALHDDEYLAAKANDFGRSSSITLLITGLLFNCFILWDYAPDPVHAAAAVPWRLAGSGALLLCGAVSWNNTRSVRMRVALTVTPLSVVATYIHIISILDDGAAYGVGGFLYFFLIAPFISFVQPITLSIVVFVAIAIFPPIAAQFGLSAGLSWPIYNAYVWLAFTPVVVIMLLMNYLYLHLFLYRRQVMAQAMYDSLTRIANRPHFHDFAAEQLERHRRTGQPISLLFIDIDHFKRINDRYGHAVGDHAIRHVAATLGTLVRDQDMLARYGGEEFVVLLSQTGSFDARRIAERMRAAIEQAPLRVDGADGSLALLAISIGITSHTPAAGQACDVDTLVHEADLALYEAKNAGRNRIVVNA